MDDIFNPQFQFPDMSFDMGGLPSLNNQQWDINQAFKKRLNNSPAFGITPEIQTQLDTNQAAIDNTISEIEHPGLFRTKRKQRRLEGRLNSLYDDRSQIYNSPEMQRVNQGRQMVGLDNIVQPLEENSETVLQAAQQNANDNKAAMLGKASNAAGYIGLAADIGKAFTKSPSAYEGPKGSITQGMDAAGDSIANAAMRSGNPYAMLAAGAYKVMGLANRVIGGGTDGMTTADAMLDSNIGFALTGGLSKLNGALGHTTNKFSIDNSLRSDLGSAYDGLYSDLDDAVLKSGKRYGGISGGAFHKAQNELFMANQNQSTLNKINEDTKDRTAMGQYEGLAHRNQAALLGGYSNMRAAKKGMKLNLDFAKTLYLKKGGINTSTFTSIQEPNKKIAQLLLDYDDNPFEESLGQQMQNLEEAIDVNNVTSREQLAEFAKQQGHSEVLPLIIHIPESNIPQVAKYWNENQFRSRPQDFDPSYIGSKFELNGNSYRLNPNNIQSLDEATNAARMMGINFQYTNPAMNEIALTPEYWDQNKVLFNAGLDPRVNYRDALSWYLQNGTVPEENPYNLTLDQLQSLNEFAKQRAQAYKQGGSFNVIPDGALHKNKHNMEDAEGLTKKGIPVVTEEDGKKVQQAEIEVNEIIFRLEVTEKLEKLAKEGTDEAALEAGKLLTEEILHNTHDNTGLIKETI